MMDLSHRGHGLRNCVMQPRITAFAHACVLIFGSCSRCLARQLPAITWVVGVCVGWISAGLPPTGLSSVMHPSLYCILCVFSGAPLVKGSACSVLHEQRGLRPMRIWCKCSINHQLRLHDDATCAICRAGLLRQNRSGSATSFSTAPIAADGPRAPRK